MSLMFIGHLGALELAGASIATSFATVTGFSLLVREHLTQARDRGTLKSKR